jgi:hypothetical protein
MQRQKRHILTMRMLKQRFLLPALPPIAANTNDPAGTGKPA